MLDNLDRIVKISEYKEIQKLLDPISAVAALSLRKTSRPKK
jgi:hypothetical protein